MTISIEYETEIQFEPDYKKIINDVINAALDYEGFPYESEVNVILTDNDSIHTINKEYRNIDNPTDVLSFPMIEYENAGEFDFLDEIDDAFNPETGEAVLGDIIISVEKVMEQADKYGHSQDRELGFLVAHSMLHLMGYDHMEPDEAAVMEKKQTEILDGLNLKREA